MFYCISINHFLHFNILKYTMCWVHVWIRFYSSQGPTWLLHFLVHIVSAVDVITVGYLRLLSNGLPIKAFCLPSQTINARHMVEHKRILKSSLFLPRYLPYIQTSQVARNLAMLAGNSNPDDIFGDIRLRKSAIKFTGCPHLPMALILYLSHDWCPISSQSGTVWQDWLEIEKKDRSSLNSGWYTGIWTSP